MVQLDKQVSMMFLLVAFATLFTQPHFKYKRTFQLILIDITIFDGFFSVHSQQKLIDFILILFYSYLLNLAKLVSNEQKAVLESFFVALFRCSHFIGFFKSDFRNG